MNKEKIIVVPDIHGRNFWRKILDHGEDYEIVFLGDYFDHYPWDGVTYESAVIEFNDIVKFAKENIDRVHLLLGNHDCHYLDICCDTSRFNHRHSREIFNMFNDNKDLFSISYRWNNTLFTHAGVSRSWLRSNDLNPEDIVVYLNNAAKSKWGDKWVNNPSPWSGECCDPGPIGDIGRSRGGYAPSGSPIWADLSDIDSGPAYEDQGISQIFSHSQLEATGTFIHDKNFWMCDSREVFIWDGTELKKLVE